MSLKHFQFCPVCTSKLDHSASFVRCASCGFTLYENPAPTAGAVPVRDGQALIGIRGIEPLKGQPDVIGGFVNAGETPEQAAIREVKEETGLDVELLAPLGPYPDTYGAAEMPTLAFHYVARVLGGTQAAHDDVAELRWLPIDDLPLNQGFKNCGLTFHDVQRWWQDLPKQERDTFH